MKMSVCQVLEADLDINAFQALNLSASHGFFARNGGVSEHEFASLNVGYASGDKPAHIDENRHRIARYFSQPPTQLCTLKQIHSDKCVYVDSPFTEASRPEADALVTYQPNIILGILTADCAPVLFHDAHAGVIGAAHAGWKGAVYGVLESTVNMMMKYGAKQDNISAAIGPCIGKDSYEVDQVFYNAVNLVSNAKHYFSPSNTQPDTHYQFDLKKYTAARLRAYGISNVSVSDYDTYKEESLFFSYRRTTHRHEAQFGRQLSGIMLS